MTHADSSASALLFRPSTYRLRDALTGGGGPDAG
jgi:hypothetical protein